MGAVVASLTQEPIAAGVGAFVDQQYPLLAASQVMRQVQTGEASADDDDVEILVVLAVSVGVGELRAFTKTGEGTQYVLVPRPELLRFDEGFVIKASAHGFVHELEELAAVLLEAGYASRGAGLQVGIELDFGGALVGDAALADADIDDAIGLFDADAVDATRAAIFEAAAE